MKKLLNAVFCYGVALTGFSQSWDLQDYKFRSLFETDSAIFSVIQDSWGISYDNGVTWTYNTLDIEENHSPIWIGFFNENYGLIGMSGLTYSYVLKTLDGGRNWITDESTFAWTNGIYHVSDGTFILKRSQGSTINITFDYGATWESVTFPNAGYTYLPELNIFGDVVYHRTGKEIYKSTDGAQSWNPVYSRSSDDMITFSFINENIGYLITGKCCDESNHNILKTTNGGTTWQESETNITGTVSALLFISESRGFIVDNENGWIMETIDGGEIWIRNTPFDTEPYLSLRTSNSAFIYGRDAFKFNPEGSALGISTNKFTIYPNPANDLVKLDFNYKDYKIIDLSGKVIIMGAYSKNGINVSSLPSGEYVLLLTMDDKVQASRFIKSK
jgi:photosystem II stability/assembly factor-like uncharacterized protein